jgi:hypothetical protein
VTNLHKISNIPLVKIIFVNFLVGLLLSTTFAQTSNEYNSKLTHKLYDTLTYEGNYKFTNTIVYDVAGYDRLYKLNIPFGGHKSYNINDDIPQEVYKETKKPEYTINQAYRFRIGGSERRNFYTPDEIGKLFSGDHVHYVHTSGNNLLESLMICKKYGLQDMFIAPDAGTGTPPFLDSEMNEYKDELYKEFDYMKRRLKDFSNIFPEAGGLYEKDYYNNPNWMWLVYAKGDLTVFDYFWNTLKNNYHAANKEFKDKYGFDLPLMLKPGTPLEKAHRIIMWRWMRRKYTELIKLRAEIFRKVIAGKGIIADNVHFEDQVDFPLYGKALDFPGFSNRPQMTDNKLDWQYLMGYETRLEADLCKKPPMISVRTNMAVIGTRIVPTPSTIKYWFSQTIQNGCAGYYLWEMDYSSDKGGYAGPCFGDPDSSALPRERWATDLEMSRILSTTKIFIPPKSETAIMVSLDANSLGNYGWKRAFSSYVALTKAGIYANFISDQAIREGLDSLSEYKVVYIPYMNFEDIPAVKKIMNYVKNGGIIICADPTIFSYNLEGNSIENYRNELFGISNIADRKAPSDVTFNNSYDNIKLKPYSDLEYNISTNAEGNVIGKYEDGQPAVVINRFGKGEAILFGMPIFDIYLYSKRPNFQEDSNRYKFLKEIAKIYKTKDLSWIWNINVDNIKEVTGSLPSKSVKPIDAIKFKKYLK